MLNLLKLHLSQEVTVKLDEYELKSSIRPIYIIELGFKKSHFHNPGNSGIEFHWSMSFV